MTVITPVSGGPAAPGVRMTVQPMLTGGPGISLTPPLLHTWQVSPPAPLSCSTGEEEHRHPALKEVSPLMETDPPLSVALALPSRVALACACTDTFMPLMLTSCDAFSSSLPCDSILVSPALCTRTLPPDSSSTSPSWLMVSLVLPLSYVALSSSTSSVAPLGNLRNTRRTPLSSWSRDS